MNVIYIGYEANPTQESHGWQCECGNQYTYFDDAYECCEH